MNTRGFLWQMYQRKIQQQYKLEEKAVRDKVLVKIIKLIYGLKQAGRLKDRLIIWRCASLHLASSPMSRVQ